MPVRTPTVLCHGEILWDILPGGRHPGGAPFNVAYHLSRQGCSAHLASAVGDDAPGRELLALLAARGIGTDGIRTDPRLPTGTVRAELDATGNARYAIAPRVAWDAILPGPPTLAAAAHAEALVYGTLAQREPANRAALARLVAALPPHALRVYDVNLRPPHDDPALVAELARHATLLKLNAAEAARLAADAPEQPGREESDARALAEKFGCPSVVITSGARGAGWLRDGVWHREPGRDVPVADTVGAGDAFLAALLGGLLLRPAHAPAENLAHACRIGEWVATRPGATPPYSADTPVPR